MCNQRDAALPAMLAAFSNPSRLGPWLADSGMDHPLRSMLRELFVAPVVRRLRSSRPTRAGAGDSLPGRSLTHRL